MATRITEMLEKLDVTPTTAAAAAVALVIPLVYLTRSQRRQLLPPGPKGLPLLGNYLDFPGPQDNPWLTFDKWSRQYDSDVIHLNIFGTDVIVINTHKAATALLERKSALYSERPRMTMINELINLNWHFGFMPHNDTWRIHRKIFAQHFNPSVVSGPKNHETSIKWNNVYLNNLLESPEELFTHVQHMVAGYALETTFGLQVQPSGKPDPFIGAAKQAVEALCSAALYGSYLVDYLPSLKNLPFTQARKDAAKWKVSTDIAVTVPFDLAKDALSKGNAVDNSPMVAQLLESGAFSEDDIRKATTAAFANGSAATVSALLTFFLAMILYPDVQKQAQAELDQVVQGRLPEFSDERSLPYISALVKEVLRWNPAVPLAFPHQLTQDDVYESYQLPSGAVVIPNAWAILQDTTLYGPNTSSFDPSRFLKSDGTLDKSVKDPDAAWGFGRRVCPGKHFAESTLFLAIARTLYTFQINVFKDAQGREIKPTGEYTSGLIRYPKPFKCSIKPRSKEHREMVVSLVES